MKPPSRLFSGSSSASAESRICSTSSGTDLSRVATAVELLRQAEASGTGEMRGKRSGRGDGIAHRAKIARTATGKRQPRQRPRQVRRAFQLLAQRLPQPRLAGEIGDGVETGVDGGGIGERAAEPTRKLAGACASDGTVDSGEQACRARALVRAHKLEIGASCGVDEQPGFPELPGAEAASAARGQPA